MACVYYQIEFWIIWVRMIFYHNSLFQNWVKYVLELALVKRTHQLLQPVCIVNELSLSLIEEVDNLFEFFFILL